MTGTGLDDFVSIINGKVMYFSAIYPIGEANVLVNEALKYTLKLDFFTTFVCLFIKLNKLWGQGIPFLKQEIHSMDGTTFLHPHPLSSIPPQVLS